MRKLNSTTKYEKLMMPPHREPDTKRTEEDAGCVMCEMSYIYPMMQDNNTSDNATGNLSLHVIRSMRIYFFYYPLFYIIL